MDYIVTEKVKSSLKDSLRKAVVKAMESQQLTTVELPELMLEVPKDKNHGNFSSNLALVLAKKVGKAPRDVAQIIVANITDDQYIERLDVAGPGFINFYLKRSWLREVVDLVLAQKEQYGSNDSLLNLKIQVEFVSANPVGPMNVVNARAAALGDTLGRLFSACGAQVQREYYVNDYGVQVETLGRSVEARYRELLGETIVFPEDCYQGEYIYDLARQLIAAKNDEYLKLPESERITLFKDFAYKQILASQRQDLLDYGVNYDCWFSERSLHESGKVTEIINLLQERGLTYNAEDALWLKTTDYGDDKDRVLITADGRTTYFTADIAYHLNKFERGFDLVIDIWGPDHHGYIPRMKAAMVALGIVPERFEVLIAQQINLLKDGQPFKMSKRRGNFITMTELLEDVGNDAARWFFLMRSPESHLDFDMDLAKSQNSENPVYYVQYAHARICSIFSQAGAEAQNPDGNHDWQAKWDHEEEELLEKVAHFPELIIEVAKEREPHRLTGYLLELAGMFHSYYNRRRIICDDPELTQARLVVARVVGYVLLHGLNLLGIAAPERM
ncbi:MAG TPA: arginine--tRNA ligase [Bacillota bacterium]|jgi:arginyl-tRNA synthetase|nr:arginine--tRNA ligase [Bacillota bacterium]HPO97997.1 arginine--tRNA ligase [Bacillota bacterium]